MSPHIDRSWIYETAHGFWYAKPLLVGNKLGLFELLAKKPRSAAEVAAQLKLVPRATDLLLHALAGQGILEKKGERFRTAPRASSLIPGSKDYLGDSLRHLDNLYEAWGTLEKEVRGKKPAETEQQEHRDFILAMHQNAKTRALTLAEKLPLTGRKHLLDVGGAAGTFAIALCRRNSQLKATVFDRPETAPIFDEVIRGEKMQHRIGFLGGDFTKNSLGGPYDAALLSNIIHSEGEDSVKRLLRKAHGSLQPGGLLILADLFLDPSRTKPKDAALFSLNMLVRTDQGRSYSAAEVSGWLGEIGFAKMKHSRRILKQPQSILTAVGV